MRPVCSSQVETIGLVRWWILVAQAIPLAATHLIGLLRYCGFGARGDPLADLDVAEIYEPGQAFYWPAGHAPVAMTDCAYVDFSPTAEFAEVIRHITGGQ